MNSWLYLQGDIIESEVEPTTSVITNPKISTKIFWWVWFSMFLALNVTPKNQLNINFVTGRNYG